MPAPRTTKRKREAATSPKEKPDKELAVDEDLLDDMCENCGQPMVLKRGRFGQFMACTGYPTCRTTRRLDQNKKIPDVALEEKCPKCERNMVMRHGKFGEFISCSGYPECKYIKQNYIGVPCPQCKDGELVEKKARRGNYFYGCSNYPDCEFTSNYKPVAEKCPQVRKPLPAGEDFEGGRGVGLSEKKKSAEEPDEKPKRKKKGKAGGRCGREGTGEASRVRLLARGGSGAGAG